MPDPVAETMECEKQSQHINKPKPAPDFIINGGDAIMDALAANKSDTQGLKWDVWNRVIT
jgi:hypothetical protein